jgi:precorrin isomerase
MAPDIKWYRPVCDTLLAKIQLWLNQYDRGKESATRQWISQNARIVDVVTMRAHTLRFKPLEIDHLIRLLDALAEHKELAADFQAVRDGMHRGRLFPGGDREVILNFYKEMLDVLIKAKTGKKTIAEVAKEQSDAGKGMFEF